KDAKGEKGNRNAVAGKEIIGVYDEYIADGAENRTFTSLVWRTWRYLQLDIQTHDQPLQLLRLSSWFTAFPFQQRARFVSDDPALSSIWEVGWRTARLDAHETYMDTPYWEQLQYVGDARIQALISYVAAGDDRLAKQAIEAFDDSRFRDGVPPQDEHGDSAPITLHFAMALREGADMESAYGDKHRAEQYLQAAQKAVQGVQFLCWNEKNGLIADTPAQQFYSQHSNLL